MIMKQLKISFLLILLFALKASGVFAQMGVSVRITATIAPPQLRIYTQPPCPYDGYMWTPGYWGYGDMGYYWVDGIWVRPPQIGYLWTPCYWGYSNGIYGWNQGYWGTQVGFYGGINYGYGYGGFGFGGGRWQGNSFSYNTAVMNVNTSIVHNTYIDRTVINNTTANTHSSFNGTGGTSAQPRPEELAAMHANHVQATAEQVTHQKTASADTRQYASVNHRLPATRTSTTRVHNTTRVHQNHAVNTQPVVKKPHTQQPAQQPHAQAHEPTPEKHK